MTLPNLILLYVQDPIRSSQFYEKLFGQAPDATFATYASFSFTNGLSLGLWSTHAKDFVSCGDGNRAELAIMVNSDEAVEAEYLRWQSVGVVIEQAPMDAVFGRTFVALDPDGHRIRVCTPDR